MMWKSGSKIRRNAAASLCFNASIHSSSFRKTSYSAFVLGHVFRLAENGGCSRDAKADDKQKVSHSEFSSLRAISNQQSAISKQQSAEGSRQ
jgi:hypothetical protein